MSSVLSALLLGMPPLLATTPLDATVTLQEMRIAPPAEKLTIDRHLSASGVLVMDLQTGQPLFEEQADIARPMASLTKLMTALIIVEHHPMNEWVKIPEGIADTRGSVAYLPPGEHFTVGNLLSALLIASANDAAVALAQHHSGSTGAFVKEMNERAKVLGLRATSYANPTGLDDPRQWSTPRDLAWLATFVQRYPDISERMKKHGVTITSREGQALVLTHTHALVRDPTSSVIAGKTGTTDAAEQCLVSLVEEEDRKYVVVLEHSLARYTDMGVILKALIGRDIVPVLPEDNSALPAGH